MNEDRQSESESGMLFRNEESRQRVNRPRKRGGMLYMNVKVHGIHVFSSGSLPVLHCAIVDHGK